MLLLVSMHATANDMLEHADVARVWKESPCLLLSQRRKHARTEPANTLEKIEREHVRGRNTSWKGDKKENLIKTTVQDTTKDTVIRTYTRVQKGVPLSPELGCKS